MSQVTLDELLILCSDLNEVCRLTYGATILKIIKAVSSDDYEYFKGSSMLGVFDRLINSEGADNTLLMLNDLTDRHYALVAESFKPSDFRQLIAKISLADPIPVIRLIRGMSESQLDIVVAGMNQERTELLLSNISANDRAVYADLISRFTRARVVAAGRSMKGSLQWQGGSFPEKHSDYQAAKFTSWDYLNEFTCWILGQGQEPSSSSAMNCWEAILFMAYKAGVVSKARLVEIHDAATSKAIERQSQSAYYLQLRMAMNYNMRK